MVRTNIEMLEYIKTSEISIHYFIEEEIQKGQKILCQNKNNHFGYIIKKGIAKCFLTDDNGNDFVQEFFSEGKLFGEIEIINKVKNFCTIESITEMTIYKISNINFQYLLENDRKFNALVIKSLAGKIHYKAIRHSHNQLNPIKSNIFRLQQSSLDFKDIISKKDIANYLGISLRSLNRILNDLKKTTNNKELKIKSTK